jgi:hypothetical protein
MVFGLFIVCSKDSKWNSVFRLPVLLFTYGSYRVPNIVTPQFQRSDNLEGFEICCPATVTGPPVSTIRQFIPIFKAPISITTCTKSRLLIEFNSWSNNLRFSHSVLWGLVSISYTANSVSPKLFSSFSSPTCILYVYELRTKVRNWSLPNWHVFLLSDPLSSETPTAG